MKKAQPEKGATMAFMVGHKAGPCHTLAEFNLPMTKLFTVVERPDF